MQSIILLLDNLDLFRKPLYLRVERQETTATRFGLLLSCAIYGLLGFFFFQRDFFLKSKPKILSQSSQLPYSPPITYGNRPFAFALQDASGKSLQNSSFFSISAMQVTKFLTKDGLSYSDIENKSFHVCNETDMENLNDDFSHLMGLFCLDQKNLTVFGEVGDSQASFLKIDVVMCKNSSLNNNSCVSQEEITEFFHMKNLNIVFMNTVFQVQNYQTPLTKKFVSTLYKLDLKLTRLIKYYFQKAELRTDETIFFSEEKKIETWAFELEKTEIGFSNSPDIPVATLLVSSSNNMLIQKRSYQTLPEAVAVLGGLFSFFVFCGKIISNLDKTIFLTTLLMNHLYSFQQKISPIVTMTGLHRFIEYAIPIIFQKESKLQILKEKAMKTFKAFRKNQKNREEIENNSENDQKDKSESNSPKKTKIGMKFKDSRKIIPSRIHDSKLTVLPSIHNISSNGEISKPKFFKKDKKSFEEFLSFNKSGNIVFNILDYIRLILKIIFRKKKTFKEKLFLKAQEIFENEIDLVKILQRIQDIEKLKYLFMSEEQISLFNILEKPMIFVDNVDKDKKIGFSHQFDIKGRMEQAFEYYLELEKKQELDQIDKKLFDLVDKRFKIYKAHYVNMKEMQNSESFEH